MPTIVNHFVILVDGKADEYRVNNYVDLLHRLFWLGAILMQ